MTVRAVRLPGTRTRGVVLPGVAIILYAPAGDNASGMPEVQLAGRMEALRHTAPGGGGMTFTVPGWQAFIAAVKAGEFDGLLAGKAGCDDHENLV